jgi:SAM-dependent methyltransferase
MGLRSIMGRRPESRKTQRLWFVVSAACNLNEMAKRTGLQTDDKRAIRGHPSQVWTPGLERRLGLIREHVHLENKRILDAGCGVGAFVRRLREFSPDVYGFDVERESVLRGVEEVPNLMLGVGERLPYKDGTFDVILMHEVLEHVDDDLQALREARRVLASGGRLVIFCPNRLYPFETHGIFFRGKYIFGNIPFVNYLPNFIRNRLVPHANVYTKGKLRHIYRKAGLRADIHSFVFPGFDHIMARRKLVGRALKWILYPLENTGLRIFGLSHFVVLRRKD